MTEQQYRVIADGLAAANAENHRLGQRIPQVADLAVKALREAADRIERPVPTTGLPKPMRLTDAEADSFHEAMHAPHPPSREQINSAVGSVLFNASNYPRPAAPHILGQDIGPLRNKVTDAVLALIQNGADRG